MGKRIPATGRGGGKRGKASAAPARAPLNVLTLEVDAADADALAGRLAQSHGLQPVQLERPGHDRAWIELYVESAVECLLLRDALARRPEVLATRIRTCHQRDWGDFWRTHFRTLDVGRRLRIRPAWEKRVPDDASRVVLTIDPGLSFGTGDHFTTQFCLEQIERACDKSPPARMLDAGTGSGILAIAAARLGCRHILAVDNDEQALRHAARNARLNRVAARIAFRALDVRRLPRKEKVDIVCANLYSHLLAERAQAFCELATRCVIVSGIREFDMDMVAAAFQGAGAEETVRDGNGEWGGLVFATRGTSRS
jgi:ribosomal protein L11 methyltransferase